MSRVIGAAGRALSAAVSAALAVLLFLALLTYAIRPFGLSVGIVESGSMEPAILTGSLSVIREADADDVAVGDIIVYDGAGGMRVEHRVTAIDRENKTMTTKGDANEAADAGAVAFDQVVGLHVFSIPYAGYVCAWIQRITVAIKEKSIYNNM